jgi:outer membrane cobalamin receptor
MRCTVLCALLLLCLLVVVPLAGHAQSAPAGTPEAAPAAPAEAPDTSPAAPEATADEGTATDEQGAEEAPEASPAAPAQGAEEAVPAIEVEVTATHEWPAKVETLTAEQIGRMVSASFIGDVLERVPGADTLHGCLNGAQLLTIRGNNSEWSELVLDGMPLSPIGRPYILSYVPMTAVDTVRILKGPVPPKYPGMTIAGLVLLDMKTGDRYPGTQMSTRTGGYGEHILDLSIGSGKEDRNYFLAFERNQTDGWMPHSDMSFNFVSGKFVVAPDAHSKLTVAAADMFGNKNGPRPLGPNPKDKWGAEWTDVQQPKASLTYERQLSDRQDVILRFVPTRFTGTQTWNQWFTDHVEQRFMPWEYGLLRGEFEHDIRVTPERIWSWGASWQQDRYSFTDPLKLTFWDNIPEDKRHSYSKHGRSLYAQYTQPAGTSGTLTLGGRYDTENPGQSIASPFVSWFKHLNSSTGLRLAFTRSRRFPTLGELYGQGVWTGNPALQPEMGWTYQADLTRNLRNGTIDLSLYDSQLEDIVVADQSNVYSNLGKARLRGAELGWQGTWRKAIWWCNYTLLDGENTLTGEPLIAAFRTAFPRHSAKAGVSVWDSYGGEHTVEVLAYGPRRTDVDEPTFVGDPWNVTVPPSLPGFTCVNYQYAWPLSSHGRFTVAVENLLNVEAQDLLFYPRPGRWISGNLSWGF